VSIALIIVAALGLLGGVRWLRIAQREHYLPAVSRFALRWWSASPVNRVLFLIGLVGLVAVWWTPAPGWLALMHAVGPLGLGWRGKTSPLRWTPRMLRAASVTGVLAAAGPVAALLVDRPGWAVLAVVAFPAITDVALMMLAPVERRLGNGFLRQATARLAASGARVVGITGSYGKTTTKGYLAHLLSGSKRVLASPASFNNRMGLARAVNEQLTPGTDVFIAEMGTYGRGEIADLCDHFPPEVAIITALGPVHLERFRTEAAIAEAKREILAPASLGVINIDHPRLRAIADEESARRKVVRCSAIDEAADVAVVAGRVIVAGKSIATVDEGVMAGNLACAVAAALYFDIAPADIARRLVGLPVIPHRLQESRSDRGFLIIDDTYNSNPEGGRQALSRLRATNAPRRVVVTPGMVELGPRQFEENRSFAAEAARVATDVVVVGATNRRALVAGAAGDGAPVLLVSDRAAAVEWVVSTLTAGDAVLYENDLPDHYP
jgi:UDP-N-acetylmuramoyl-tripeptide--D-alanyl-D-alanine ligase